MVDEVIVFLGRIIPGGPREGGVGYLGPSGIQDLASHVSHCPLALVASSQGSRQRAETLPDEKGPGPPRLTFPQ